MQTEDVRALSSSCPEKYTSQSRLKRRSKNSVAISKSYKDFSYLFILVLSVLLQQRVHKSKRKKPLVFRVIFITKNTPKSCLYVTSTRLVLLLASSSINIKQVLYDFLECHIVLCFDFCTWSIRFKLNVLSLPGGKVMDDKLDCYVTRRRISGSYLFMYDFVGFSSTTQA